MKNIKKYIISALILMSLSFLLISAANSKELIRVYTRLKDVSENDINRVKAEADKGIEKIKQVLAIDWKKTIDIEIVDYGICRTTPQGGILLPIWHVRKKTAAIIHEVTHILTKQFDNKFFAEGLAIFFQEKYGEDHGFPNLLGVPLDNLVRENKERLTPITQLAKDNDVFIRVGTKEREIAYIQAGSFFIFLVERYGENKLKELHDSWRLNYKKIYGKDLNELEFEWKKFVFEK